MGTVTNHLAEFALSRAEMPEATLQMTRLSLLDWVSCGVAGVSEPVSGTIRNMVLSEGGAAQAVLFGGGGAPARSAALVNGTVSHALDYDDTHFAHIGHPSVAVTPAALAVAELVGADGVMFLDATARGVEASIRFGEWLGRMHYQIGFHQTGTAGSFGATVAAGRLLGLSHDEMGHALGLVATKSAALKSQFGTMGKPYNAGLAASAGVEAALLAQRGFVSNPEAIEGPQGFGPTHHGEGRTGAFEGLGADWRFDTISHKFHACCHGTHAMIEALHSVRDQVSAADVERVEVRTHPRWMSVCNIAEPGTGLEAKFSYRLIAAMVLAGHDTGALSSFSKETSREPALTLLRDKVRVETDEGLSEMQAAVSVAAGGRLIEAEYDLDAPLTLQDREEKLRRKSSALIGGSKAEHLAACVLGRDAPGLAGLAEVMSAQ